MSLSTAPLATQTLGTSDSFGFLSVESDIAIEWNLHIFVARNRRFVWNIVEFVAKDFTFVWDIEQLIDSDVQIVWSSYSYFYAEELEIVWTIFGDENLIVNKNRVCRPRADRKVTFCG